MEKHTWRWRNLKKDRIAAATATVQGVPAPFDNDRDLTLRKVEFFHMQFINRNRTMCFMTKDPEVCIIYLTAAVNLKRDLYL